MLALRLFKERMFRNANIVTGLAFGSFAGLLFILPLFLQTLLGLSAIQSGLTTFPQAVGMILASQVAGRLYHSVGPRRLVIGGLIVLSIVTFPLAGVGLRHQPVDDPTDHVPPRHLHGVRVRADPGVELRQHRARRTPVGRRRSTRRSARSRRRSVWRSSRPCWPRPSPTTPVGVDDPAGALDAFQVTFFVAAALVVLAAASAFLIRDRDAAEHDPATRRVGGLRGRRTRCRSRPNSAHVAPGRRRHRCLAGDGGAVHRAAVTGEVGHGHVLHGAVVPDRDVADAPLPPARELGAGGVREQEVEQRRRLVRPEATRARPCTAR